jgi:tRNA (guanine26-N2/guanine27-N2)-dimethyltransferase
MYTSTPVNKRFTVIDLDPYGGPNQFLDGAIQSLEEGGLLLVTATYMAVLAGNTPEACIVKYGSVPLKSKACHEMALRILLRCTEGHANRYGRYIKPLLSLSIDFYARVLFVSTRDNFNAKKVARKLSFLGRYSLVLNKTLFRKQSMVFQCTGCEALTIQPLAIRKKNPANPNSIKYGIPTGPFVQPNCEHCAHKHHVSSKSSCQKIFKNLNYFFIIPRWADQFSLTEFTMLTL